jgi:CDP-glucose 4,6-dehydratase
LIDFDVFSERRVLVTGHTGFKGTWLKRILDTVGAVTSGLALAPEEISHSNLLGGTANPEGDIVDIRSFSAVRAKVLDFDPEVIFHLAAQPLVRESYRSTLATYETNFMGGVNLLESVREASSLKTFIFITSDKAYENVEWEWGYRENDRLGGIDPYSASKGAVEIALSSYIRSVFKDRDWSLISARAGNVIGGGDFSPDRIIPDIVRSAKAGQSVEIRNPGATRPWQHVLEPLSGYLKLAELSLKGEVSLQSAYNFGPHGYQTRTVQEVAESMVAGLAAGSVVVKPDSSNMHEAGLLALNCDRAARDLSWSPRWDFDRTIQATSSWYKTWLDGADVSKVTDRQILEYFTELQR